jgi:hypothetical protein
MGQTQSANASARRTAAEEPSRPRRRVFSRPALFRHARGGGVEPHVQAVPNNTNMNSSLDEPPSLVDMEEPESPPATIPTNMTLQSEVRSNPQQPPVPTATTRPTTITTRQEQQQLNDDSPESVGRIFSSVHTMSHLVSFHTVETSVRSDDYHRRTSACSSVVSDMDDRSNSAADEFTHDSYFYPQPSRQYEWMGRSIESLVLAHVANAPPLQLQRDDEYYDTTIDGGGGADDYNYGTRRRSTASTFARRRSSQGSSFPGGRRGSLSLVGASGGPAVHGGTLANYYSRRRPMIIPTDVDRSYSYHGGNNEQRQGRRGSTSHAPMYRRRSSMAGSGGGAEDINAARAYVGAKGGGPNVVLTLLARETTGKSWFGRNVPATECLRSMGGHALYAALDKPAGGIATEVAFLAAAIDTGDWTETQTIISRLAPRIIGDPMATLPNGERSRIDDPSLPPTAPRFYAGGGRAGLERDAFVHAGGVEVIIRVFREKSFVGQEMAQSYDARDLSPEIVATRLAPCWNEALASLRELVFSIPSLVDDRIISDGGELLPFLFTLLSHDSCFDAAAALIEEILALLSQSPQQSAQAESESTSDIPDFRPVGRVYPPTTFYLGNVPDLYKLWMGFNCRQLAHFCRILALLVFEPEDRQLLESPAVLKSLELLRLRRNRAVRAARDSTVDMNQAILLGDEELIIRLLKLLRIMNFAPSMQKSTPYHVMALYPFISDTLVMLGLGELDNWSEVDRQEKLARKLLDGDGQLVGVEPLLSELATVADMLEGLSETLSQPSDQIGHIIHVISAAQHNGVIVGRGRGRFGQIPDHIASAEDQESAAAALRLRGVSVDSATIQDLASVANILTDQVLFRRLYQSNHDDLGGLIHDQNVVAEEHQHARYFINTPEDSANSLQFNAIILGSYQVEVLFVFCTLLGGRRKLDTQNVLEKHGLIPLLEDMFQRLPWFKNESIADHDDSHDRAEGESLHSQGMHGPGCECTPESALYVQYLRFLHNFCDRDCDNYGGRRLLLSPSERAMIFNSPSHVESAVKPGLLSKLIGAFINESDESPYRFWLASCIESYLRGSSPNEQMFAAQSGLMKHLIDDVSSDRLHCAGSLQTSFDLLGELGKGHADVVRLMVNDLDEKGFRKLMSVAAANLVDSNVFIRSLLLTLERVSVSHSNLPLHINPQSSGMVGSTWTSQSGYTARSFLTHSWWEAQPYSAGSHALKNDSAEATFDEARPTDWFPSQEYLDVSLSPLINVNLFSSSQEDSVGHYGWVFSPSGDTLASSAYLPNSVERLSWFLAANQARLLRDLLGVVDLRNINHENICCLNTAVVVAMFANRRQQLAVLLDELREMNDIEKESKRQRASSTVSHNTGDDIVDRAFAQAVRYLDLENQRDMPAYARISSINHNGSSTANTAQIGDRSDVIRNFREVIWFWKEYYAHRGRDRLSLEFSSHLRFQEWNHVIFLLTLDDGSPTALARGPARLPRSPYQRAARIADNPLRGV